MPAKICAPQPKIPCDTTKAWCRQINKYFLKYTCILVFKRSFMCSSRKNHKETDVPFNFALEISKGQWPDYIALFSLMGTSVWNQLVTP